MLAHARNVIAQADNRFRSDVILIPPFRFSFRGENENQAPTRRTRGLEFPTASWLERIDRIEAEHLVLLNSHVHGTHASQGLADPGASESVRPVHRDSVSARLQVCDEPIKAVSGNGAFVKGDEASARDGQALA